MSIIRRFKYLIVLILIPLTLTFIWFRNGLILGGGEEGLIFYNPAKALEISQSTWVEINTGLPQLYWLPRIPFLLLTSFLVTTLDLPSYIVQAGLFFILIAVGIISVYYLTLNLLEKYPSKYLISFIASIFYLFNPFSASQIWARGIYPQFFAFALLPLSLFLFVSGLKQKKYFYILLMVLSSVIFSVTFGSVTYILTYWVILFLFYLWWLFLKQFKKDEVFFGLTFLSILLFLWSIANAWWLLPIIVEGNKVFGGYITGGNENLGTLLGVSRNFTPDIIIRLLQRTYYYDASAFSPIYLSWFFQLISWASLVFVLYGLYSMFKHQLVQFRFFAVLLILGLIVSLGANPPFGWLFVWVFKKVSILQAFRNPFEKFGLVYVLGYSAVFAYGLISFFEGKKIKWFGLGLTLFLTCVVFAYPMWTGRVIAGPDKKIGIDVPIYYKELNEWLKTHGEGHRLLMTPIWSGEGAFYQWGDGARYQGVDPMAFILDEPAVSSSAQIPYYFDFITAARKYMERIDVVPALALLRTKFLVDRKDAIFITDRERDHYKFLTSTIYPAHGLEGNLKIICQNMIADSTSQSLAWVVCQIPKEDSDLSNIRYLHLRIRTDVPANLEVAVRDSKDTRIRWDGRMDSDYNTGGNEWQYITIPLSTPTEYNSDIDFAKTAVIEVMAHPKDLPQQSVGKIEVSGIRLDPGIETPINEFKKIEEFGNLTIYQPLNFNSPPEFGLLLQVAQVENFVGLFNQANEKRNLIDTLGFLLPQQNPNKDLNKLGNAATLKVLDKQKVSDTRYWLRVNGEGEYGLILLSKTFNSNWKVIEQVEKKDLTGNIFDDIKLLQRAYLSEDNHFVVNGYANLWKVDGKPAQYAVIFMPQIIADIAARISLFGTMVLIAVTAIIYFKKWNY